MMKGFVGDPNVAPFVDDIYAYLQARADGALARVGRDGSVAPEVVSSSAHAPVAGPFTAAIIERAAS